MEAKEVLYKHITKYYFLYTYFLLVWDLSIFSLVVVDPGFEIKRQVNGSVNKYILKKN